MVAQALSLPDKLGYDFGVGIDRLSGTVMNQVVEPTPSPPLLAQGVNYSFSVSRIASSTDLQRSLGIDVEATYGCASFGAGISARFGFTNEQHVHSENLFVTITATVQQANQSIDHSILTDPAKEVVNRPTVFSTRYGDLFARACSNGGLFVGVLRVETSNEESVNSIEAALNGSYGVFSADAAVNFKTAVQNAHAAAYFRVYAEGGPEIQIVDPTDPREMLTHANEWMAAMRRDPEHNSRPYQWYFSPLSIAEAPVPPNAADIEHGRDVLILCARARTQLLDLINKLAWITSHQADYNWQDAVTPDEVILQLGAAQSDLDTIAGCASNAIEHPDNALTPTNYAISQGTRYPTVREPRPLPTGRPIPPAAQGHPVDPEPFDWRQVARLDARRGFDIAKLIRMNK